jgi:hypothetical protein
MAKRRKQFGSVDVDVKATGISIDLVRADSVSTSDSPLTPLNIAAELESLADRIETDAPSVSQRAQFCAWRLRDLIPAIGRPDGIVMIRDSAGRPHFPIAPRSFDLLEALGLARSICNQLRKHPVQADSSMAKRLRKVVEIIRKEVAKLSDSSTNGPSERSTRKANTRRATTPGENPTKIISTLASHHNYKDGGCGNFEPIGSNALSRKAKVSPESVTEFWKRRFRKGDTAGDYTKYVRACRNNTLNYYRLESSHSRGARRR